MRKLLPLLVLVCAFPLLAQNQTIFFDDMDHAQLWSWPEGTDPETGAEYPIPMWSYSAARVHSGAYALFADPSLNSGGSVTSPPIDLRFVTSPQLSFFGALWDPSANVDVWVTDAETGQGLPCGLSTASGHTVGGNQTWAQANLDLSACASRRVRITFLYGATYGATDGYYVDDVRITGSVTGTLNLDPPSANMPVGSAKQIRAWFTPPQGAPVDVSADVTWATSAPLVASIERGIAHSRTSGNTTVTASYHGITSSSSITASSAATAFVDFMEGSVAGWSVSPVLPAGGQFTFGLGEEGSHTPSHAWYFGGDESRGVSFASSVLTSPLITLAGTINPTLHFWTTAQSGASHETGLLEVQVAVIANGQAYPLSQVGVENHDWTPTAISLAGFENQTIRIEFTAFFGGTWDSSGWAEFLLDDVAITGPVTTVSTTGLTVAPAAMNLETNQSSQLAATASRSDGTTPDVTNTATWSSSNPAIATVTNGLVQAVAVGTATITATYDGRTANATVTISAPQQLPPDPRLVAPPIDQSTATSFGDSISFLYTGTNPIQRDVAAGAINAVRAAVIRGRVLSRDGQPLSGVRVSVLGQVSLGWTLSRVDGAFDVAVNGGGSIVLEYQKNGYLPAQREVGTRWKSFGHVDDVALIPLDAQVTTITASAGALQTARGTSMTDSSGTRTATVLFPSGAGASMTLPNGTTQQLTTLSVRATEYTLGANGPKAMPAPLPPTSGYTYCVELSVDEAIAANAKSVTFTKPVALHVENFLGFPIGTVVPVGYYDRSRALWVAAPSGVVLKITAINGGVADVDLTGDDVAETATVLEARGISVEERSRLASLYTVGQSLWRAAIDHFTPYDLNWPTMPSGARRPARNGIVGPSADVDAVCDAGCTTNGSILSLQNQSLGESLEIAGTPFSLVYQSTRVPGRKAARTIDVRLTETPPESLTGIDVTLRVAGQVQTRTFSPSANLTTQFEWDGKDAYGRNTQGGHDAIVTITYRYPAVYAMTSRFGSFPEGATLVPGRTAFAWSREYPVKLRPWNSAGLGLGGWMIDAVDQIDTAGDVHYRGDGSKYSAANANGTITTLAGVGQCPNGGSYSSCPIIEGSNTRTSYIGMPQDLATAPDGSIFFTWGVVYRIDPAGLLHRYAGGGSFVSSGDGGPALQAGIINPGSIARAADGTLYVVEKNYCRIRRISPDGTITRYAGLGTTNGTECGSSNGDGGLATAARISPKQLSIASDGTLYFIDANSGTIRRVTTDGVIDRVAGGGPNTLIPVEGARARDISLATIVSFAVGPDSLVYFQDGDGAIWQIGADGLLHAVVPIQCGPAPPGCNPPFCRPLCKNGYYDSRMVIAGDGTIYTSDLKSNSNYEVRRFGNDGRATVIAGGPNGPTYNGNVPMYASFAGDGGPAAAATFSMPSAIALASDGALLIADTQNERIRRVAAPMGRMQGTERWIPTPDGSAIKYFNEKGQHVRTVHSLTGTSLLTFGYDTAGRLVTITDASSNVTSVERDANGKPTGILAPGGQRTTLTIDGAGYLATLTAPGMNPVQLVHTTEGLLRTMTDPKSQTHTYTYDTLGRLESDDHPAGTRKTLALTRGVNEYTASATTLLGRSVVVRDQELSAESTRTFTDQASLSTTERRERAGIITTTLPDGTVSVVTSKADPRFGTELLVPSSFSVTMPSGKRLSASFSRSVTLAQPTNPTSMSSLTESLVVNGAAYSGTFNGAARTWTIMTPTGRQDTRTLDALGRTIRSVVNGMPTVTVGYNAQGRIDSYSEGARTLSVMYDSAGRISTVTTPFGDIGLAYDAAGEIATQVLPGGRSITYTYDANGNVQSITPPGRPAHLFSSTALNQTATYAAPSDPAAVTSFTYDGDGALAQIERPGAQVITIARESTTGRITGITYPGNEVTITYNTRGQVATASTAGAVLTCTYDGSLLTSMALAGTISGTVSQEFDAFLRLERERVNGAEVSFGYDTDGILTRAGALTIRRSTTNHTVTGAALGQVDEAIVHNTEAQLESLTTTFGGASVAAFSYGRDSAGRITQQTETLLGVTRTITYTYDSANRLHTATVGADTSTYTYDANGNRTTRVTGTQTDTGTHSGDDRLLTYANITYSYHPNGSLQSKAIGGSVTLYNYDAVGNLRGATLPDSTVVEYVIDAQDRRIGKKIDGTLQQGWLYSEDGRVVAELEASGSVRSRFVYGTRPNIPDYMIRGGIAYKFVVDHLGSPRVILNTSTGAATQIMGYDEFGRVLSDTNPGFQPFGFAGGLYDPTTGLVRFGSRDYDPQPGRWTTKDPIGFGGGDPNLYAYALNNPLNYIDRDGRNSAVLVIGGVVVTGVVAVLGAEWLRQHPEGIRDLANGLGDLINGISQMAKGGESGPNYIVDWVREEARKKGGDVCDILDEEYRKARACGNTQLALDIKYAQKFLGCRKRGKQ